jgi:hypothetical protein
MNVPTTPLPGTVAVSPAPGTPAGDQFEATAQSPPSGQPEAHTGPTHVRAAADARVVEVNTSRVTSKERRGFMGWLRCDGPNLVDAARRVM